MKSTYLPNYFSGHSGRTYWININHKIPLMKMRVQSSLFVGMLSMALVACQEPAKTPGNTLTTNDFAKRGENSEDGCHLCDSTAPTPSPNNCSNDRYVKQSCIQGWTQEWKTELAAKGIGHENNTQRTFRKSDLHTLRGTDQDCDVRVYFGIHESKDKSKHVAMAITKVDANCNDVYHGGQILTHVWYENKDYQEFMDTSQVVRWVRNWGNTFYGGDEVTFFPTKAYTMSGAKFWPLVDASETAITCELVCHKVEQHCDIPAYGDWQDGWPATMKSIDLVIRSDNGPASSESKYLDFAAPCPKACGGVMIE